ncbi:unnamed protein product, partial [Linum tenue]
MDDSLEAVRCVVESLKIIARQASLRVAEYAFHYAKANIIKGILYGHKSSGDQSSGLNFLPVAFLFHLE